MNNIGLEIKENCESSGCLDFTDKRMFAHVNKCTEKYINAQYNTLAHTLMDPSSCSASQLGAGRHGNQWHQLQRGSCCCHHFVLWCRRHRGSERWCCSCHANIVSKPLKWDYMMGYEHHSSFMHESAQDNTNHLYDMVGSPFLGRKIGSLLTILKVKPKWNKFLNVFANCF